MSTLRPLIAGALIAAAGLIGVNGIAYAATGGNLILGHSNHASTVTKVTRTTKGPALALHVKSQQVPFTVNSTKQVAKLNASYLGGMAATSLQTHARRVQPAGLHDCDNLDRLPVGRSPAGTYDASFRRRRSHDHVGQHPRMCARNGRPHRSVARLRFDVRKFLRRICKRARHRCRRPPLQLRCFTSSGTCSLPAPLRPRWTSRRSTPSRPTPSRPTPPRRPRVRGYRRQHQFPPVSTTTPRPYEQPALDPSRRTPASTQTWTAMGGI